MAKLIGNVYPERFRNCKSCEQKFCDVLVCSLDACTKNNCTKDDCGDHYCSSNVCNTFGNGVKMKQPGGEYSCGGFTSRTITHHPKPNGEEILALLMKSKEDPEAKKKLHELLAQLEEAEKDDDYDEDEDEDEDDWDYEIGSACGKHVCGSFSCSSRSVDAETLADGRQLPYCGTNLCASFGRPSHTDTEKSSAKAKNDKK